MRDGARVVVTGLGAVTSLGANLDATWRRLVDGACGIAPIRGIDASNFPARWAAEAPRDLPFTDGNGDRRVALAWAAAREALAQAGPGLDGARLGLCVGAEAGRGCLDDARRVGSRAVVGGALDAAALDEEAIHGGALAARSPGAVASALRRLSGARGPGATHALACASSAAAIAEALDLVRTGACEAVLAVGAAADVDEFLLAGFCLLGALSPTGACRPFDARRDGFVLGEGAAALVIESAAHASRRGARAIVELAGAGASLDAFRMTDPPSDGAGARLAIERALTDANATPREVACVIAHGTGTQQNDVAETAALDGALDGTRPPVTSIKGAVGHLIAAAGALGVVVAARALAHGIAPPTVGLDSPDPACAVRASSHAIELDAHSGSIALANALAFGGSNVVVALRRA